MKLRSLLQAVDFGDDVAEFDEQLSKYFIETSSFLDVVNDRADLILGVKGSGKTAIFRHLANAEAKVSQLDDVDIIPAFNLRGSVIFSRLVTYSTMSSEVLRTAWFAYFVALVGNHIIETYRDVVDVTSLHFALERANLRAVTAKPELVWPRVERLLKSLAQRMETDAEIELGVPNLAVKGTVHFRPRQDEVTSEGVVDLEKLLSEEVQLLQSLGRKCWLLFDRLDESFYSNPEFEQIALSGLLRAHLDLSSYGTCVKTKLFLRTDVLDRVTRRSGFVNATHLRTQKLVWDRDQILDLIARRVGACGMVTDLLKDGTSPLGSQKGRRRLLAIIVPQQVEGGQDILSWIEMRTCDASKALNPRNVITLLRLAREHQLRAFDRDDPDFELPVALITDDALIRAFEGLSKARLEDTLFAEFPWLRSSIEKLRGKPVRMTKSELSAILSLNGSASEFHEIVDGLNYCGVVAFVNPDLLSIPLMYRPALNSMLDRRGNASGIPRDERLDLQKRAQQAAIQVLKDRHPVTLLELDSPQRKYIHEYIKKNFQKLATKSGKADSYNLKPLEIRLRKHSSPTEDVKRSIVPSGPQVQKRNDTKGISTPPPSHFVDVREMKQLYEDLVTRVESSGLSAVSRPLTVEERQIIEDIAKGHRKKSCINHISIVGRGAEAEAPVFVAPDLSGESGRVQDESLEDPRNVEKLHAYLRTFVTYIEATGLRVDVRPMSSRVLAEAMAYLRDCKSVTWRIRPLRGSFARIALFPDEMSGNAE